MYLQQEPVERLNRRLLHESIRSGNEDLRAAFALLAWDLVFCDEEDLQVASLFPGLSSGSFSLDKKK